MNSKLIDDISYILIQVAITLAAWRYFQSVWVRDGYVGINKIFELFEVKVFNLHVVGFILLVILVWMIHKDNTSREAWILVGSLLGAIFAGEIADGLKSRTRKKQEGSQD